MAVKSSGPLSITTDIVGEFGGVAPHSISEFYDGAGLVPTGANPNVPSSGAVSFSNFYGAVNVVTISIINNQYDSNGTLVTLDKASTLNLFEIANKTIGSNAGNNVVVPLVFSLDSDTVFNNSIIFGGSFTDITIQNNGDRKSTRLNSSHGYISYAVFCLKKKKKTTTKEEKEKQEEKTRKGKKGRAS